MNGGDALEEFITRGLAAQAAADHAIASAAPPAPPAPPAVPGAGFAVILAPAAADSLRDALAEDRGRGHRDDPTPTVVRSVDGSASVEFSVAGDWDRRDVHAANGYLTVTTPRFFFATSLSLAQANQLREQLIEGGSPARPGRHDRRRRRRVHHPRRSRRGGGRRRRTRRDPRRCVLLPQ